MDRELDALGMLDLIVRPGFCVQDKKIIKCNPAAQAFLLEPGMDIGPLLAIGAEEYASFSGGCLYLTLTLGGSNLGCSVTRMGDLDVFLVEDDADQAELQAMALAARELREPLANVMTTAERIFPMDALEDNPQLKAQSARLNRGLHQILRVIGNMSDALSYSQTVWVPVTVNITAFMQEIFDRAEPLVAHTGIRLSLHNLSQDFYCSVDTEKLERSVMNILSNALKFTPPGGIISISLTRRDTRLYLTIQDSGEGIPDALRGSIHRRYQRRPGLEDGRFGIGLGMVLIRSTAAVHGGTVLIDHPENAGTRITMTLAIRQDTAGNVRSPLLRIDYAGERDHTLLELSEVLPAELYDSKKFN